MNLNRIARKVKVRVDISPDTGEYVMYLPEEENGPVVTGNTFEEARFAMDQALTAYSAITSLINAINSYNMQKDPEPVLYVGAWAA